ncbi:MAG: peptidase U32 family protein, partial [Plesiomonas sp.]
MMVQNNRLELLAPAKNAAFGIEAIKHGADAVYIGGPAFGARSNAGNSVADIELLTTFAHRYGAQVFVALNTILKDSELAEAELLTHQLWNAGADALIVQDMGLLQLDLPPIALHASTQLDNRTPEKVKFLQDVGFSQVVLARELSLEQIAAISAQTSVQLEFFIHGALCVAYSGQCYISHSLTGRSANRGECAQICRVPCSLKNREGEVLVQDQHLLSLKDMNQSAN